jgi:Spy/CpxP family protein refolding chaperone
MRGALMAAVAGLVLAVSGCSHPYGRAPGTMGGDYGPGGYGMGPEMMRDDGSGPGYRHGGYGMNPGMMWGDYGPGGYGMGPGMMRAGGALKLTDEQRAKIAEVQSEFRRKQWSLMEKMHEQGWPSGGLSRDGKFDEQAARKAYDTMADMRKQMFENSLEAHKRIDSVLTPQQREQIHRGWGGR